MNLRLSWLSACVLVGWLLSGCAQVLGIEATHLGHDAGSSQDAASGGASNQGTDFSCVGNISAPTAQKDTIQANVTTLELDGKTPIEGLQVEVCTVSFSGVCQSSIDGQTDASGNATIQIPLTNHQGFDGYVEISGHALLPDGKGGNVDKPIQTLRWYFTQPKVDDFPITALMPDQQTWQNVVAGIIGKQPDPTKGYVTFETRDCSGNIAPNVSLSLKPLGGAQLYYFSSTSQNFLSEAVMDATDVSGRGGFFEVTPGAVQLDAIPKATGQTAARFSPQVDAQVISFVELDPNRF